ncbi:MAG TPA: alpha-hydroxy acid oxidase [Burkholderiales bacterium]|nr:alpha-hydroxy acid oxidase [Burkholderiales bacterium]
MADVTRAYSIADLRRMAERSLPRKVFDFFDGGAEDEITLRDNRAAFERVRLLPRVLNEVRAPDLSCEILGGPSKQPFVIAPTGGIGMAWPGADLAIARTAKSLGIPYTLSTNATASLEDIVREGPERIWFQLYVLRDRAFVAKLVDRAEAAGCEALIPTVDLAVGGKRERDFRNGFTIPPRLTPRDIVAAAMRPRWALRIALNGGLPDFPNVRGYGGTQQRGARLGSSVGRDIDPAFCWEDLARLRERWKRKLVVKGVSRVDDAERLVALGVDGIWVSNHGGRQLDGAIASLDAMTAIARAVGSRVAVLMDGGVRRGIDVLKARALGAQAVAIGRAALYGIAAGGETGARQALGILTTELVRGMQLCGACSIAEVTPDLVTR